MRQSPSLYCLGQPGQTQLRWDRGRAVQRCVPNPQGALEPDTPIVSPLSLLP